MGNRASIVIKSLSFDSDIVIYGRYAGEDNLNAVISVLADPNSRIGDPSYLTAQIFFKFANYFGQYDGTLGYGISAWNGHDGEYDDNPLVIVDADNGNYCIQGEPTLDRWGNPTDEEI